MGEPKLEEVFKTSGVPTYTFVRPEEYQRILVSLRTAGRGLVVEGPSGIGKTTSIQKALEELNLNQSILLLTARKQGDRELIAALPSMKAIGTVLIDDFHRLEEDSKKAIADFLKTLADEELRDAKVIVVGINKAGDSLVKFAADLNNRIDTVRFEANSDERVLELVQKGEQALNISLNTRDEIVKDARGSFHIAQMLCRETCLVAELTERSDEFRELPISLDLVREKVLEEMGRAFGDVARQFSAGPRLRKEGRAPYLHMLNWLASSEEWSLQLDRAMVQHPGHKGSVGQVIDKGYLSDFIAKTPGFSDVIHYDRSTRILSAEDPKFRYFLHHIIWNKFARQVGILSTDFGSKYDFALSFAGADRAIAEQLHQKLAEAEFEVFYDKNEQHRILAQNIEDYLGPIYRSEAEFVVALLSAEYPKRIWTKFESEQFKNRFGSGSVIPIWFSDAPPGMFDETSRVGGLVFDSSKNHDAQISEIVDHLSKKLSDYRIEGQHKYEG